MLYNGMSPQNGLIVDENGEIHSLVQLLKNVSGGSTKMIELQKGSTHIQWKYADEEEWFDLIAVADLKGAKGATGATGTAGFGTQEQYNNIINRLNALEQALTPTE